jgi:hypothetical protein
MIHYILLTLLTLLLIRQSPSQVTVNHLAGNYIDQRYMTLQPFGYNSQWIYPWRSYMTTVPASAFINGCGVNFNNNGENIDLMAHMVSKYGFKRIRIEIGWGDLDYQTESMMLTPSLIQSLQTAKTWGLRPLIVLNSNQGAPCPSLGFYHTVLVAAPIGSTSVTLDSTANLVVGKSGFSQLTSYTMCQVIITGINGNTVTLSQPLPVAFTAGQSVLMNTFKYVPFDVPDDPGYNASDQAATMAGWNHYTLTIAQLAAQYLGTTGAADLGFDLEIWNEFSFGSQFLFLPYYYGRQPPSDGATITGLLRQNTADTATNNPSAFAGVTLEDGFGNQNPFVTPPTEPARIGAIGKHFYPQAVDYPSGQQKGGGMLNAQLVVEPPPYPFVPTYNSYMPEYGGMTLQTEDIIRFLIPFTFQNNGQNSRVINGIVVPCTSFLSEIGMAPSVVGITDSATAQLLKAKGDNRILTFYLNKGAGQVDLFAASGTGDSDFEVLSDAFLQYARANSVYPADDSQYVSPMLQILGRIVSQMQNGLDPAITEANTRPLAVKNISDTHNHFQFQGDGTAAHPPGYDREAFAFLPFQVNAHRFVIPYYVMTRNPVQPLIPEAFTLRLQGIHGIGAIVTAYDPLNDAVVPVTVKWARDAAVNLVVTAADYPYLLIIQESR